MPTTKNRTAVKKAKPVAKTSEKATPKKSSSLKTMPARIKTRLRGFLARRPHRSFRRTRRRDYVRSLKMPGYWAFTSEVRRVLWQNKKLFLLLALTYGVLNSALVGLASQDTYAQLSETLHETGTSLFSGGWGTLGQAGLLLVTSAVGVNQVPTDTQQIFAALLGLMVWLTAIWLLRAVMSGKNPKLRDGLYNGAAPMLSSFLISLLIAVQLLPVALAIIGFSAAVPSGLLDGGVEAMLFWLFAGLLGLLSLYWISSSIIALVVVTLPGVYPMQALRTAGDLVVGRRSRILLRLLWVLVLTLVLWAAIMIPIILFDSWLKNIWPAIEWLPLVPVALAAVGALMVVWMASYVYLLYRKVVDDGAAPA